MPSARDSELPIPTPGRWVVFVGNPSQALERTGGKSWDSPISKNNPPRGRRLTTRPDPAGRLRPAAQTRLFARHRAARAFFSQIHNVQHRERKYCIRQLSYCQECLRRTVRSFAPDCRTCSKADSPSALPDRTTFRYDGPHDLHIVGMRQCS
jgi:hypothetical protein